MKKILHKLIREEKGQALIIALILLGLGGLLIAPLMAFMSTGLEVGREVYEERMAEVYAADAGIEDGVWKIMNLDELPDPYPHLTVNGKDVEVTIPSSHDAMIDFFKQVGALDPHGMGDYKKAAPASEWMVVYAPVPSAPGVYETYEIQITYNGVPPKKVDNIGAWIYGLYSDGGGPGVKTGEQEIPVDYPNYNYNSDTYLGTYFIWEWKAANRPVFVSGETKTLEFTFSPPVIVAEGERFPPNVAWVRAGSDNIFISWQGNTGMSNITAKATDLATSKSTTVTSYIFSEEVTPEEPVIITILTWDISLQ